MDDCKNIPAVILGVLVFHFAHTGTSLKCNYEVLKCFQLLHEVQSLLKTLLLPEEDFEALVYSRPEKLYFTSVYL